MDEKHLYLIDGHALAYRAYFAMIRTPMSNSRGQPTGAVYGFALILLRLLEQYKCPYIAVVFDSPKPTFRHELYKEYKANRVAMPDDMQSQMPLLLKLVDCLNITRVSKDGLEADDIIAHLATTAAAQGYSVSIVSKDKDLMQLVGGAVRMLVPEGGAELAEYGPQQVKEKMGVTPGQIRDLLALMGDSSDNVPGIPGVGPKTAVKILEAAGDVESLLKDPSRAGNPKLAEKIAQNIDKLTVSRDLVTLKHDIDAGVTVDGLAARPLDKEACVDLFKELEFGSFLKNPLFDTKSALVCRTAVVASVDEVGPIVEAVAAAGIMSVDTETTSTAPREAELVGISIAVGPECAWYLPVGHAAGANLPLRQVLDALRPCLESDAVKKCGQNLKYDYQVLRNYGIMLRGIEFDAMIAAYLVDPGKRQYGLEALAGQYLGVSCTPIEELIGKGKTQISFADVPVDRAAAYSGEDAVLPLRLRALLAPLLQEKGLKKLFDEVEIPLVTILAEMEWHGVVIDSGLLRELSKEYTAKLTEITRKIHAMAGLEFNLNSPKQISDVLFNQLGLPKSKKTKTGMSTDVDALEKLAPDYPVARELLGYREVQKLLSTYIDALPGQVLAKTGRLHSSFNQTIAATGRLSSTNPNLQNIPVRTDDGARIREAFVAPPGRLLVSADYSQIELRILAHLSEDPFLRQAFMDDKDIHTQTASAMYKVFPEMVTPEMRRAAKTINFGLMYGMGPINLSRQLSISFKEAQRFIDDYFGQFPSIRRFMERCIAEARERGYSETVLGRRRYLPDINAEQRQVREAAERVAVNTPVQGSAADIIKIAMVNIAGAMPQAWPEAVMVLQVHDELVFEVPEEKAGTFAEWVKRKMGEAYVLSVPLKVDAGTGRNWREAH